MTTNRPPTTTKKLKCIVLGGAGAGKTSILRRYFHDTFDLCRTPTVGSDFYSKKIHFEDEDEEEDGSSTNDDQEEKKETTPSSLSSRNHHHHAPSLSTLSIQVWDTPGRERYAIDSHNKPIYTSAFSDKFFQSADAALLVYDITSSTSFTHCLKWHADLMSRQKTRVKPLPILIVANKIDIWKNRTEQMKLQQQNSGKVVRKRDVMGFQNKTFKGKDLRYEYSASPPSSRRLSSYCSHIPSPTKASTTTNIPTTKVKRGGRFEISTYMGTGDQTSYLEAVLTNQVARGTYLESLLTTEDGSYPDGDLVNLWCMRNGLKHFEVSALDGTGVDELMSEMVHIALDAEKDTSSNTNKELPSDSEELNYDQELQQAVENNFHRFEKLDLHGRYAPKPRSWLSVPFQGCCKPK